MHETLSVSIDEAVDFDEVVDRLLGMLADVMGSAGAGRAAPRRARFGELPAEVATALVLVLTELVQNAIEHAFPDERRGARSTVDAQRGHAARLTVTIVDDGVGPAAGLRRRRSDRLGLQIVRTLVSAELDGTVEFRAATPGGTGGRAMPIGAAERGRR